MVLLRFLRKNLHVFFLSMVFVLGGAFLVFYALTSKSYHETFSRAPFRSGEGVPAASEFRDYAKDLENLESDRYQLMGERSRLLYEEGLTAAHLGFTSEAIDRFTEVLRETKDTELLRNAQYNLGVAYLHRVFSPGGSPQEDLESLLAAKVHFEETLKMDPEYENARFNLEKIYLLFRQLGIKNPGGGSDPGGDGYSPPGGENDY